MSPYLFIICAEGLSALIRKKEDLGLIYGCKVARNSPAVSHLFFTDDYFLFFHTNLSESGVIQDVLQSYEVTSKQTINLDKSTVMFSHDMASFAKDGICASL